MTIGEAMQTVQDWVAQDFGQRRNFLESMEYVQTLAQEAPQDIPWEVRAAYNKVMAAFRELFGVGGADEQ